jgi:quercetin dioxygenase-like cupin family protein
MPSPSENTQAKDNDRDARFARWMQDLKVMMACDPDRNLPDSLVTSPDSAVWLDSKVTKNASRIGVLIDVPAKSMEFYLQELPPHEASDLQRHNHESVHIVTSGGPGYSEIGERRVEWNTGDLIYTPVMAWHRHYNTSDTTVRMLLVENSPLLQSLGLNRRESAGNIPYKDLPTSGI